jgi:NTP pyrophosphatase (non-canonical NTP hydrolase)
MDMKKYQEFAQDTCLKQCQNIPYLVLGLCGEAGEVAEKIKKTLRDGGGDPAEIAKELGDVLWYLTNLATFLKYDLSEIAQLNKDKLISRLERGTFHGSGDNR